MPKDDNFITEKRQFLERAIELFDATKGNMSVEIVDGVREAEVRLTFPRPNVGADPSAREFQLYRSMIAVEESV